MYHTYRAPFVTDDGICPEKRISPYWSWTSFFFGFFVPLFRQDWNWVAISFFGAWLTNVLIGELGAPKEFFILYMAAFASIYNRVWIRKALLDGWHPIDQADHERVHHVYI